MSPGTPVDLVGAGTQYTGRGIAGRGNRTFGGSTLGQALRAADLAQQERRRVDCVHAIFVAPGIASSDVDYTVREVKRGRSIDVFAVEATQGDRTILAAHVSFHDGDASPEFQDPAPAVPGPDELTTIDGSHLAGSPAVRAPFESRPVISAPGAPHADTWIRLSPTDAARSAARDAAMLLYATDFLITRPAHLPLDDAVVSSFGASLDHSMWFHRPVDLSDWLLVSASASAFVGSRSLCTAQVFDRRGLLIATATQEALLPPTRPRPTASGDSCGG